MSRYDVELSVAVGHGDVLIFLHSSLEIYSRQNICESYILHITEERYTHIIYVDDKEYVNLKILPQRYSKVLFNSYLFLV